MTKPSEHQESPEPSASSKGTKDLDELPLKDLIARDESESEGNVHSPQVKLFDEELAAASGDEGVPDVFGKPGFDRKSKAQMLQYYKEAILWISRNLKDDVDSDALYPFIKVPTNIRECQTQLQCQEVFRLFKIAKKNKREMDSLVKNKSSSDSVSNGHPLQSSTQRQIAPANVPGVQPSSSPSTSSLAEPGSMVSPQAKMPAMSSPLPHAKCVYETKDCVMMAMPPRSVGESSVVVCSAHGVCTPCENHACLFFLPEASLPSNCPKCLVLNNTEKKKNKNKKRSYRHLANGQDTSGSSDEEAQSSVKSGNLLIKSFLFDGMEEVEKLFAKTFPSALLKKIRECDPRNNNVKLSDFSSVRAYANRKDVNTIKLKAPLAVPRRGYDVYINTDDQESKGSSEKKWEPKSRAEGEDCLRSFLRLYAAILAPANVEYRSECDAFFYYLTIENYVHYGEDAWKIALEVVERFWYDYQEIDEVLRWTVENPSLNRLLLQTYAAYRPEKYVLSVADKTKKGKKAAKENGGSDKENRKTVEVPHWTNEAMQLGLCTKFINKKCSDSKCRYSHDVPANFDSSSVKATATEPYRPPTKAGKK